MSHSHPNFKRISQRIREMRKNKGITQEQLAEYVDVNIRFIAYVEAGIKKPSFTTLFRIAEALGTTIDPLTY